MDLEKGMVDMRAVIMDPPPIGLNRGTDGRLQNVGETMTEVP